MAKNCYLVVLLVVLVATAAEGSRQLAKKASPDQQVVFCNMTEAGLNACKPSVTKGNPVDPPVKECCQALGTADLKCLCSYKNSFVLPSLGIDPDLAMALPSKCKLPSVPQC